MTRRAEPGRRRRRLRAIAAAAAVLLPAAPLAAAGDPETDITGPLEAGGRQVELVAYPIPAVTGPVSSFQLSSTDGAATFECKLDEADWAPCPATLSLPGLADGGHTIQARAVHPVGLVRDPTPAFVQWLIDQTPPTLPTIVSPADGATITGPLPAPAPTLPGMLAGAVPNPIQFRWTPTSDAATAVYRVELWVDGALAAALGSYPDCLAGFPCSSPSPPLLLADGPHTAFVRSIDDAGNVASGPPVSFRLAMPPRAALEPLPVRYGAGPVTLDASASVDNDGPPTSFRWDLNGDGRFDGDTGASPVLRRRFAVGRHRVRVLVTAADGLSGTAVASVVVRTVPPPGPVGITVDGGAPFSRGRRVTVNPIWPRGAQALLLSNDGGFRHPRRFAVQRAVPWWLPPLRPGQSAVVYARFVAYGGAPFPDKTFQDDIVIGPARPHHAARR